MAKVMIVIPDNGSRHHWFPLGAGQISTQLERNGHEVRWWHQDIYHYPAASLAHEIEYFKPDSVGIGWVAGKEMHRQGMALCDVVRKLGVHFVIGGHGPSSDPEWHIENTGASAVVVGDADGLAYEWRDLDGIVQGKRAGEWWPWWHPKKSGACWVLAYPMVRAPGSRHTDRCAPIVTGHGCPYSCSFCYRMTKGRDQRDVKDIMSEIGFVTTKARVRYIQFQDELLMTSANRVTEICEAILETGLPIRWSCQGRVNVAASHPEVLPLMYRAGCRFINYGIESASDNVLKLMGKRQNAEQSRAALDATRKAGISPGINVLWGCPGDDSESLRATAQLVDEYTDDAQLRTIRPVTPYPGSRMYIDLQAKGEILDTGDFYRQLRNSDLINWDMMDCGDIEAANRELMNANMWLLSRYRERLRVEHETTARMVYIDHDESFRGWRQG